MYAVNIDTLGAEIKESPVFYKKMSLFWTGITLVLKGVQKFKKNQFEVRSVNLWAEFCKALKIRGYVAQQPK